MTHMFTKRINDFIDLIEPAKFEVMLLFGLVYWFGIISGFTVWAILINDYYIYQNLCTVQFKNNEIKWTFEDEIKKLNNTIDELKKDLKLQKKYSKKINKKLDDNDTKFECIDDIIKRIKNDMDIDSDEEGLNEEESNDEKLNNEDKLTQSKASGFTLPQNITPELAKFLGLKPGEKISRVDACKPIIKYIKDNNLCVGRNINPDEKLKTILVGYNENEVQLTFFNLQKFVGLNYIE